MPNGRFVSRSISMNEQLAGVSLTADFFFQRMIPHLDNEGRLNGNPAVLKGLVCPLRGEITIENIPALLVELGAALDAAGHSMLVWYEVGAQRVLAFPRFEDHQTGMKKDRERQSRLPSPSAATRILAGVDPDHVGHHSGPAAELVRPKVSEVEVQVEVQGEGEVKDAPPPPAAAAAPIDIVTAFLREHDFGPFSDSVEGLCRSGRHPLAIISTLRMHLAGELGHEPGTVTEVGLACQQYLAQPDPFSAQYFAGFVRTAKRGKERTDRRAQHAAEGRFIATEQDNRDRAAKEQADADRVLRAFKAAKPERYQELKVRAEADTPANLTMGRAEIVRGKLFKMIRDDERAEGRDDTRGAA